MCLGIVKGEFISPEKRYSFGLKRPLAKPSKVLNSRIVYAKILVFYCYSCVIGLMSMNENYTVKDDAI